MMIFTKEDRRFFLGPLRREMMHDIACWRNVFLGGLRTPFFLTSEMQLRFYDEVICNRAANSRYSGLYYSDHDYSNPGMAGMVGLNNIAWENGSGEISMLIRPELQNTGCGRIGLLLLLCQGFDMLRLHTIHGEVYECNPAFGFWEKMIAELGGSYTTLPDRKFWKGEFHDALYFSFTKNRLIKEAFEKNQVRND